VAETWDELASSLASAPAGPRAGEPTPTLGGFSGHEAGRAADPGSPGRVGPSELDGMTLTAQTMDRIASRVVEQLSDRVIREIAWEVIPEIAENLIRQRIKELEEKISREG